MVAFTAISSLKLPAVHPLAAPAGAAVAGVAVAAVCALVPTTMLEGWVWRSGVPALIAAAEPPLGTTARAILALTGGALSASVVWSVLYLLFGTGGLLAPKTVRAVPTVRRADAHPDAPPRWPMTAADLGTPLMDVAPSAPEPCPAVIERTLPADLDQPLSAFDPGAVPDVPMTPSAPVAPLARLVLAPGERIDTYVLTPPQPSVLPSHKRSMPPPAGAAPSIDALLHRLEARLGSVHAR